MKWLVAVCLACAPVLWTAARGPDAVENEALLAYLGNMQLEARWDVDLTGDGRRDAVYVASNPHERVLGVIAGGAHTVRLGDRAIGEGTLEPSPQVPVTLDFRNGVLTVEDLVAPDGTDMVTLSRYQYRYEPRNKRMRLFAVACEQYSPSLSHGSRRISWNLDSGQQVTEYGQVVTLDSGEDVYIYGPGNRTARKTAALYMEDAPRANDLLATGVSTRETVGADDARQGVELPRSR